MENETHLVEVEDNVEGSFGSVLIVRSVKVGAHFVQVVVDHEIVVLK